MAMLLVLRARAFGERKEISYRSFSRARKAPLFHPIARPAPKARHGGLQIIPGALRVDWRRHRIAAPVRNRK